MERGKRQALSADTAAEELRARLNESGAQLSKLEFASFSHKQEASDLKADLDTLMIELATLKLDRDKSAGVAEEQAQAICSLEAEVASLTVQLGISQATLAGVQLEKQQLQDYCDQLIAAVDELKMPLETPERLLLSQVVDTSNTSFAKPEGPVCFAEPLQDDVLFDSADNDGDHEEWGEDDEDDDEASVDPPPFKKGKENLKPRFSGTDKAPPLGGKTRGKKSITG